MDNTVIKGPYRETGAAGRRVLAVAAWRSEDRELRALLSDLKERMPCSFDLINLESPTAIHFRMSARALFNRIRLYDAVVFVVSTRIGTDIDGTVPSTTSGGGEALSPALRLPEQRLPFGRHFIRRIPAGYLVDGPLTARLETAIDAHARAWRLLPSGIATVESGAGSLAGALLSVIQ